MTMSLDPTDELIAQPPLLIRRLRDSESDYARLAAWLSDPRVLEFYEGRDRPFSLETARATFGPAARGETGETAALLLLEGEPVGYLQFYPVEGPDRAEYDLPEEISGQVYGLDLFIGKPELWGTGLGTRAVRLLLKYLFSTLRIDWAVLDPQVNNPRAVRTYQKCGFRQVRLLPAHELHEGQWRDAWLMAVSAEDYRQQDPI